MIGKSDIKVLFDQTSDAVAAERVQDITVPVAFLNDLYKATTQAELLQAYALWGRRLSQSDRCSVALDNGENSVIKHALESDFDIGNGISHDIANTAVGEVVTRRRLLYVPDLSQVDLEDTQQVHGMGYASAILAPILTEARCFGTLAVSYREVPEDPAALMVLTQAMARCLAIQLLVIEQMDHLAEMARTDALTGAGNRRALYEHAATAWRAWRDDRRPFCFLAIDVDHFKQINDTYGHDVGDAILCAFVQRIEARCRESDQIIRTGGEEFGMLMHDTDITAAIERANRLCDAVGDTPFAVEGMELNITASFGLTEVLGSDAAFDDVLKRADTALYTAKAAGRDQVVAVADEELAA